MDSNLLPRFDTSLPVLRVYRWKKKNEKTLYIFVGSKEYISENILLHITKSEKKDDYWHSDLEESGFGKRPSCPVKFVYSTLWPDDDVKYGLIKVLKHLQHYNMEIKRDVVPFAWNKNGLLRFDWPSLEIDPVRIDPWEKLFPIIEKQPYYIPHQLIGTNDINIILYEDLLGLTDKEIHMYFPDVEETRQLIPSRFIDSIEEFLVGTWTAPIPIIRKTSTKIRSITYTASFDSLDIKQSFSEIFETKEANDRTQLVQWTDDVTRVMYKLYKKHTIKQNILKKWIDRFNIPDIPSITMYDIWDRSARYTRVNIQENGDIQISYVMDTIETTFEEVTIHINEVAKSLENILGTNVIDLKMFNISYDFMMATSMIGIDAEKLMYRVNKDLGNAVPVLFPLPSGQEGRKKTFILRRASNIRYEFSLSEISQSLLEYGVESEDVRRLLLSFGYTKQQIDNTWDELRFAEEEGRLIRPNINLDKEDVPIITFLQNDGTFTISIKHSVSTEEAKRALKWISSIIFNTIHASYKEAKREEILPVFVKKPSPKERVPSEKTTSEEEKVMPSRKDSSSSFEFDGGANIAKKSTDGFLLEKLQRADKSIFANEKVNYARGCQQKFQPLSMTPEEWDNSKSKVANSIKYRGNYYSCPSIWCKETGIVMTPDELKEHNGKCPKTGETPIVLWSEPKQRFVGFNKNIVVDNGERLYSPCCFKTDQFSKAIKKGEAYDDLLVYNSIGDEIYLEKKKDKSKEKEKEKEKEKIEKKRTGTILAEETYIFKKNEPVPEKGRYGSVPMALYRLLYPQYAEQGNNITTQPTIVRHGIGTHNDSLLESIAYALDLGPEDKNKGGLIEKFLEVLDPLAFISLEGGAVLASFISNSTPTISYDAWKEWIDGYPDYILLMGLNDSSLGKDSDVIMREIKIYEAYLRFIHHLQSDDEKNIRIIYTLLAMLGVLLIVWERGRSDDDVMLTCPYFIGYEQLSSITKDLKSRSVMLLYDGNYKHPYYEPLEIRSLNDPAITKISLNNHPLIKNATSKCPIAYHNNDIVVIEKIRGMIYWTSKIYEFNTDQFMPKYVVLGNDLCIEGLITNNMLWIQLQRPSVGILPRLIDMLQEMRLDPVIRYHEDIDYEHMLSNIGSNQYDIFRQKCESFGFRVSKRVPPPAPIVPIISLVSHDYEKEFMKIDIELKDLRDVQLKIARYLLYNYDEKISKHLGKSRKDFIDAILNLILKDLWKKDDDTPVSSKIYKQTKTAIEEMPLIYGKESLKKWIHTIGIEPFHFYDSNLYTEKKSWTFSQLAVEAGLPKDVIMPTIAYGPNDNILPDENDVLPAEMERSLDAAAIIQEMPLMAQEDKFVIEDMPIKWRKINIQLMRLKRYDPLYLPNLYRWISHHIHSPLSWNDVLNIRYINISNIFEKLSKKEFLKALEPLLQESTFRKVWIDKLKQNKNIKDEDLLEAMWKDRLSLSDVLREIAYTQPSSLWPMQLDIQIMAQLLDIFVMIIFRKPYSSTGDKKISEIENLRLSSELYCNQYTTMERPLIILYREKVDNTTMYHLTLSGNKEYYYPSASESSSIIQSIIHAHMEKRRH